MPTERKIRQVEELKERLIRCTIAVATNPTGLDVNAMGDLRRRLRERSIEYRVVKNTLTYIAADSVNKPEVKGIIQGMTGLAFGFEDPTEVAKVLEEFIRTTRSILTIRGAVMDHRVLTPQEVTVLATLPPRLEIIAKLLGQAQAPITRLVGQLQSPLIRLVGTLNNPLIKLNIVLQRRAQQLASQG